MNRSILIPITVFALSAGMAAQRMGSAAHLSRPSGFHSRFNRSSSFPALYPFSFFDPLYSDYPGGYSQPNPPTVVVVQSPAYAPAAESVPPPPSQPLMIELRGNSYVQVSGSPESQAQTINEPVSADHIRKAGETPPVSPPETQSALLVFRDGHSEEVSGYTIANGLLYATADYYTAGSWNRTIQISSLNLPETIESNRSRGVPFHLPGAANEVIVGP